MTCETAIVLLHFARPGGASDLAAEDQTALTAHLATCPACAALATRHTATDAAIATAMKNVTVPIGFRDALLTQAISVQNGLIRARWASRFTTAMAATVLLALGYGAFLFASKTNVDSEQLLAEFERHGGIAGSFAFEDWRQAEGLPPLPGDFDTRLMAFAGRQPLQGALVPTMRLRTARGEEAAFYFVRSARFNLKNAVDAIGSHAGVKVYANQPGGWTIIVVHSGASLNPFLHNPGASV